MKLTLSLYVDTYRDSRRRVRGVFVSVRINRRGRSVRFHWCPLVWSYNRFGFAE